MQKQNNAMHSDFNLQNIKLIIGLGNVGDAYEKTRHNAGFLWVDELAKNEGVSWSEDKKLKAVIAQIGTGNEAVRLVKPTTMMNSSGTAARAIMDYFKVWPQHILVVHDDLDIPLGEYKLQWAKGPKGHNGLISIEKHLGTDKYWHLRLGIDARAVKGNKGIPGMEYSLQRFPLAEMHALRSAILHSIGERFRMSRGISETS
jgi:peptidyl-tRNA hydrolase, PTH1 family